MTLTEHSNVGEITDFLLFHMDSADDSKSIINPSFTRSQIWNVFMSAVFGKPSEDHINHLAVRNMIQEFGDWWDGDSHDN